MAKDDEKEAEDAKGGRGKKMIIILVPVVLLLAAGGWFFFLRSDGGGGVEALPEPAPGAVIKLEPITVNLAGGHFLKIGMALQPTASAVEVDGSKALDLTIAQFSQMSIDDLTTTEGRTKAKEELVARIKLAYLPHGTDFSAATSGGASTEGETPTETPAAEGGKTETEAAHTEVKIAELPDSQVLKMAEALTVQPEVYDVYFTEFVMQ